MPCLAVACPRLDPQGMSAWQFVESQWSAQTLFDEELYHGTAHEQIQTLLAQTTIATSLPHMELDDSSRISTPPDMEPVMEYSLMLTTLSGETFKVSLSVAKFDRFEDLEDQVFHYLASFTDLKRPNRVLPQGAAPPTGFFKFVTHKEGVVLCLDPLFNVTPVQGVNRCTRRMHGCLCH